MPTEWDEHTALEDLGGGRFAATLHEGWSVGGGVHGGYQLGMIGKAISMALPRHTDPLVLSAYFLSPATQGPAEVHVRSLRAGRGSTTVSAELTQGGAVRLAALATFGDLTVLTDEIGTSVSEPALPPREQCVHVPRGSTKGPQPAPATLPYQLMFDPSALGWATGSPSGTGHIQAWLRLNDEHEPDPVTLLLACDALPPVSLDLGRTGWAPTMELTVHVRAQPAPGWLKVSQRTRNVAGGLFEEDCEVWDSRGRLVAQSRQLAKMPR